jgi:hypothetical protein
MNVAGWCYGMRLLKKPKLWIVFNVILFAIFITVFLVLLLTGHIFYKTKKYHDMQRGCNRGFFFYLENDMVQICFVSRWKVCLYCEYFQCPSSPHNSGTRKYSESAKFSALWSFLFFFELVIRTYILLSIFLQNTSIFKNILVDIKYYYY